MEEDTIFYGGVKPKYRFGTVKVDAPDVKIKGFTPYKSTIDLKKQRQTGRVSAKKAAISKVSAQKTETAKFQTAKADAVKVREIQATRAKLEELESKFENPIFKNTLAKSVEAKQASFGKKLSPEELRVKVEAEMKKIKENADLKAQKAAAEAQTKISNNNNEITAASKVTLSGKIDKLKSDFANRLNEIRNRGADPGSKPQVDNPGRVRNDSIDAKNRADTAVGGNKTARGNSEKFSDASNKANNSANKIENPGTRTVLPDGSIRTELPDGTIRTEFPDGTIRTEFPDGTIRTELPDGTIRTELPDGTIRTELPDGTIRTELPDGTIRTELPDGTIRTELPDGTIRTELPDGTIRTELPDGTIRTEFPDGTIRTETPDGKVTIESPDGTRIDTPERVREIDARNNADTARNRADNNLEASRNLVGKLKNFLRKVSNILGQLIVIVLPIVISMLPFLLSTPKPPRSLNPFSFTIRPPPPPIISPSGDDNIFAIYRYGSQSPEAAQPEEYYESFGNIVFQLTEQPSETVSFQVTSLSDSLEFYENIVTFPLENWSAPVYLNFISSLESSADGIVYDIREDVSEKLNRLKQEKRVDKRPDITIGSLDDYSTTNEEINARRNRLEYMLRPSETIQQALAKINKRVQMRESLVEPTYGGGYSEYRGIVEPTYDTKITEEQVEPTYDDSEYKIQEDKVYPSEKIIREETYEPIEEVVDPTYDDSDYKDYSETVVPTLDGGQEEESYEEDILPELDYDTIVSKIDETQLSDNYKAEIEFILLEDITSEVNIVVSVLDPIWTLKPYIITFNSETPATTSFFFSQEIYTTLQNLYAEQYANQLEDKFYNYIEDEYETGMNSISEREKLNRMREEEIYDDVYDKVYQQELSKIEDAEYILKQLGGYNKPTVSRLFKRTRKLPRIVEK